MSNFKVLTANRLTDGIAVWLSAAGDWETEIDGALVARHDEAIAALEETGQIAIQENRVVDVNVIDVQEIEGRLVPTRLRERIRVDGPSIEYINPQAASVQSKAA